MIAIFGLPGGPEWIIIGIVLLLVFGRRLPEVARSLGKGVVEFKRGLHGIRDEVDQAVDDTPKLDIGPTTDLEPDPPPNASDPPEPPVTNN